VRCGQHNGEVELDLETGTSRARIVTRALAGKSWVACRQAKRGAALVQQLDVLQ
jgi:hypothetical protein